MKKKIKTSAGEIQIRGLLYREFKILQKEGLLADDPQKTFEATEKVLKMVLSENDYEKIDSLPVQEVMSLFAEVMELSFPSENKKKK